VLVLGEHKIDICKTPLEKKMELSTSIQFKRVAMLRILHGFLPSDRFTPRRHITSERSEGSILRSRLSTRGALDLPRSTTKNW